MASAYDDFVPVTGGAELSKERVREDVHRLGGIAVGPQLDRHILRLLTLHADPRRRFGDPDLARLDEHAKRALLEEMNEALGIRPASDSRR